MRDLQGQEVGHHVANEPEHNDWISALLDQDVTEDAEHEAAQDLSDADENAMHAVQALGRRPESFGVGDAGPEHA